MKPLLSQGVTHTLLRRLNVATALWLVMLTTGVTTTSIFASATSNVTQTITAGTLSVDIVTSGYASVGSPTVAMSSKTFSFACQTGGSASTGSLASSEQVLYVKNPDAADGGWTVSLAASSPTAFWDGTGAKDYDFNDATTAGCWDSSDTDSLKGQMTITPTGTPDKGTCLTCGTTGVALGSGGSFSEVDTIVNSVTVLTGAAGSDDIGDWKIPAGITISQTIPAEQAADTAYNINMVLTIV